MALAAKHGMVVDERQDFDSVADTLDVRRPDEHRGHPTDAVDVEVGLEGVDLTPEGVTAHGEVDHTEAVLVAPAVEYLRCQQDHPRTGAEGRHALVQTGSDGLEQPARL